MGTEVTASCEGCGYEPTSRVGGGMRDFTTTCWFPCLCEDCGELVEVNLLGRSGRCPKCRGERVTAYDDPVLQRSSEQERFSVADWDMSDELGRQLVLTDGEYRCPKCGEMTLRFRMSALFD